MEAVEYRRLQWHCRRGLLENDLVLERFLQRHGPELEGERLRAFQALLEYSDNDLRDLVSGRSECDDPSMNDIVGLLRRC
jgi:succinate dehydrogenase flavin-adding protein (antitoxin of CptAB toxin-antitoxin module)